MAVEVARRGLGAAVGGEVLGGRGAGQLAVAAQRGVEECMACPAGAFCPGRVIPCPLNSYNALEGQEFADACKLVRRAQPCVTVGGQAQESKAADADGLQGASAASGVPERDLQEAVDKGDIKVEAIGEAVKVEIGDQETLANDLPKLIQETLEAIEEAKKKCTDKHENGCYVHYSSQVAFGG